MIKNNEQKRLDHNLKLLKQLKLGDLVEYKRELYSHWAVYIGNGKIVHLAGKEEQKLSSVGLQHLNVLCSSVTNVAEVRIDHFLDIIKNSYAYRNNSKDVEFTALPDDQILTRALAKIGTHHYDLFEFNCEHFAHYCRYDLSLSDQASRLIRFGCTVTKGLKNFNNLIKDIFKKPSIEFSPSLVQNPGRI